MGASRRRTQILIVGGGPGGLAAAAACRQAGARYLLVEAGPGIAERSHRDEANLTTGVGGAGLYSDGKFSFYPSATRLWELPNGADVTRAYEWLSAAVGELGVSIPRLPEDDGRSPAGLAQLGPQIGQKTYTSMYMSLADRQRLIEALEAACGESILLGVLADRLEYDDQTHSFGCSLARSGSEEFSGHIDASAVVFAGGRFGSTQWDKLFPQVPQVFRRLEVGVRLEQKADEFFLRNETALDPKLILRSNDPRYTWRTFCCCREGQTVLTRTHGLTTVSGRGDCGPTGLSNVGFNLLVTDRALGVELWDELRALNRRFEHDLPRSQELNEFLGRPASDQAGAPVVEVLGVRTSTLLAEGLGMLRQHFPALQAAACKVVAPTLEGVAHYTDANENLQVAPYPLWVAGDATGIFRGLTAALISGYYSAVQATKSEGANGTH